MWLREAIVAALPGQIIPQLPGMAMEGMLEKVDALIASPGATEVPALVTYRMRSLELFLKFLGDIPEVRAMELMYNFVQDSPEEMSQFQVQWRDDRDAQPRLEMAPTVTGSIAMWFKKSFIPTPKTDPGVDAAKEWAKKMEASLDTIKSKLEEVFQGP